jgi:uncharacterized protein with HEPN domain
MRERNTRIPRVPKTVKRPHRNMGFFFYTGMELECIRKLHRTSGEIVWQICHNKTPTLSNIRNWSK